MNKVQLILPPSNVGGIGYAGTMVPLGILQLARTVKEYSPSIEVEVLDGTVMGYDDLVSRIDGDVVGLSVVAGNYAVGKELAKEAKSRGSTVVLGNHHVRYLYDECLRDQNFGRHFPEVDFLVESQYAEKTFVELLDAIKQGEGFERIPSLGFRDGEKMIVNDEFNKDKRTLLSLEQLLPFLEGTETYSRNYNRMYSQWHDKEEKLVNTNMITGCFQGVVEPCSYCCLRDFNFSMPSPEEFWNEMAFLESKGYTLDFEACNSLSSLKGYVKRLADTRPQDLDLELLVYAKAEELDDNMVELFQKLKVKRAIFGLDSLDDKQLSCGIHKSATVEDNFAVLDRLKDSGIDVFACFVPGSKGETPESLGRTVEGIKRTMEEYPNVSTIEFTSFAPMPGSTAWGEIREDFVKLNGESDVISVPDLARNYLEKFTNVSWDEVEGAKEELKALADSKGIVYGGYY